MRPTLTLYAPAPISPRLQRQLHSLLQERCGPCAVVINQTDGPATTYTLTGTWLISAVDVHRHLVDVFDRLVTS